MVLQVPNQRCLHRNLTDTDEASLFEKYNVFSIDGLSECRGYVCRSKQEVLLAYELLTSKIGHNSVVIKDCCGASGFDISFWASKKDIAARFAWKQRFALVAVEENLSVSAVSCGAELKLKGTHFVGCQWYDGEVSPVLWRQIIVDGATFAGASTYDNKVRFHFATPPHGYAQNGYVKSTL